MIFFQVYLAWKYSFLFVLIPLADTLFSPSVEKIIKWKLFLSVSLCLMLTFPALMKICSHYFFLTVYCLVFFLSPAAATSSHRNILKVFFSALCKCLITNHCFKEGRKCSLHSGVIHNPGVFGGQCNQIDHFTRWCKASSDGIHVHSHVIALLGPLMFGKI